MTCHLEIALCEHWGLQNLITWLDKKKKIIRKSVYHKQNFLDFCSRLLLIFQRSAATLKTLRAEVMETLDPDRHGGVLSPIKPPELWFRHSEPPHGSGSPRQDDAPSVTAGTTQEQRPQTPHRSAPLGGHETQSAEDQSDLDPGRQFQFFVRFLSGFCDVAADTVLLGGPVLSAVLTLWPIGVLRLLATCIGALNKLILICSWNVLAESSISDTLTINQSNSIK